MRSRNRMFNEKEMEDKKFTMYLPKQKSVQHNLHATSNCFFLSHGMINVTIELAFRIDLQNALTNHRPMQSF